MLDLFVSIMIYCLWIAIIGGTLSLFALRLFVVIQAKLDLKQSLLVLFIPCSIGYYRQFPEKSKFKAFYQLLVIVNLLLMLIGFLFVIYTRYL